jgi:hypothetical protein
MISNSLSKQLVQSLRRAAAYNRNLMVRPEVVLWPDPERQWESVIPQVQAAMPELLVLGAYEPEKRKGPVIWIKTMVAGLLSPVKGVPVVYLPGMGKQQLKRLGSAPLEDQPLLEYLYTGNLWLHRNGREWTVAAFLQNEEEGLGLNLAQDSATKEALMACLPGLFGQPELQFVDYQLNASFFRSLLVPNLVPVALSWINEGEPFLRTLNAEQQTTFASICQDQFGITPTEAFRLEAARMLGQQHQSWGPVWAYFANSPAKYTGVQQLLRAAMPGNPDTAVPEESWPQVNEAAEARLRSQLAHLAEQVPGNMLAELELLEQEHGKRRDWVWSELGQAPLAHCLRHIIQLATVVAESYPTESLEKIRLYYQVRGYLADQALRYSLAAVDSAKDREVVQEVTRAMYLPWLTALAERFQRLAVNTLAAFEGRIAYQEQDSFVLFVDALRWELGVEFADRLRKLDFRVEVNAGLCALPSITPTSKAAVSPIADQVSASSEFNEFSPQSLAGKELSTFNFRELLARNGFVYHEAGQPISRSAKYWQEIGDIDSKGHGEGARMAKRVDELFDQVLEALRFAFEQGVQRVRIVTDHGWLLMPGGLPKAVLTKDLAETRWGRCALIKEGAKSDLTQLPWRWNKGIFIAYAPGVSFFKANVEYAHGGISLQECLVPNMVVQLNATSSGSGRISAVKWVNLRCRIEVVDAPRRCEVDIRTKFSDPDSSVVLSASKVVEDGFCSLMVDDRAEEQAVTIVLLDDSGRIIDKLTTTVGEN